MNTSAERHLAKAQGYLEKGDGFYEKAGAELRAAKDEGATWPEIADRLGRSDNWCRKIVVWSETPANERTAPSPFSEPERETTNVRGARQVLSEAPMEQVEQIIADLSPERQKKVAAAAGHEYLKARNDLDEEEQRRTIAQHKERQAAGSAITEPARKAAGGFASLGIAGHIDQATEELRELVADASVSPDSLQIILRADAAWRHELQVAAAMVGLEVDLQEVR